MGFAALRIPLIAYVNGFYQSQHPLADWIDGQCVLRDIWGRSVRTINQFARVTASRDGIDVE